MSWPRSVGGKSWFYTRTNQILLDSLCFTTSLGLAFLLQYQGRLDRALLNQLLLCLPVFVALRACSNVALGVYRQVWRFVSLSDSLSLAQSTALGTVVVLLLRHYLGNAPNRFLDVPISLLVLETLLSLSLMCAIRVIRRLVYSHERKMNPPLKVCKRALLYGAGRAGIMLRKELENNPSYEVVGFVDDDRLKVGTTINGTRVVGAGKELESLAERLHIDEVIISMATAGPTTLARVLASCRQAHVPAKIIPSLHEILSGQIQISQLREPRVEEVLGRQSVEVRDFEMVAGPTYYGKRLLVTGAGGSIGSELVRQIARLDPTHVAILDKDENSIYELEQELKQKEVAFKVEPIIADVRELNRLRSVWGAFRPQMVFHAAAHKHVPLMEHHPCEAVLNNVGGTKNVLDVCHEYRVERVVFISSDKAVNPTNVMGATKRIGELLIHARGNSHGTRTACVRFGNVLGSRGSVIPLFQRQIAAGGPVTVTHPEIERYFMTIQEAVQLILCAGTLARSGEIFVLDMGKPRNILEMARELILLSGREPGKDIEVRITGLRPGEKMTEELVTPSERLIPSTLEKLSVIEPQALNSAAVLHDVHTLLQLASTHDPAMVIEYLRGMGLGYQGGSGTGKPLVAAAAVGSLTGFPLVNTAPGSPESVN